MSSADVSRAKFEDEIKAAKTSLWYIAGIIFIFLIAFLFGLREGVTLGAQSITLNQNDLDRGLSMIKASMANSKTRVLIYTGPGKQKTLAKELTERGYYAKYDFWCNCVLVELMLP